MPPRRRRVTEEEEATPTQTRRRTRNDTPDEDEDVDTDDVEVDTGSGSVEQLVKGLVRYAISCEHSRRPIKRPDINEKVLGSHTRLFKEVFNRANAELMDVFGMKLQELPKPEKVTVRQKRAAAASQSQGTSTSVWVLQTILPSEYRTPDIIGPSRPLYEDEVNREDAYVGLYTMTIALITISGGRIPDGKLDRAFRRMNADQNTPMGTKDKTLALMAKDQYIAVVKNEDEGETIDYIVGPRGKVEIGREGFASFIKMMFGDEDEEELQKRIERTLDIAESFNSSGPPVEAPASQVAGRKRGRRRDEDDE